jgi:hypothetical protein
VEPTYLSTIADLYQFGVTGLTLAEYAQRIPMMNKHAHHEAEKAPGGSIHHEKTHESHSPKNC